MTTTNLIRAGTKELTKVEMARRITTDNFDIVTDFVIGVTEITLVTVLFETVKHAVLFRRTFGLIGRSHDAKIVNASR